MERLRSMTKAALPASVVSALRRPRRRRALAGLNPVSRCFGMDRSGTPIDRHYIEAFLAHHAADIRGRAIEVGDDSYIRKFGGDRVSQRDILHVIDDSSGATIVGDIQSGAGIPTDTFDCFLCTQTLMFIADVRQGVATIHRSLKRQGVVLATVAGISQICRYDMDRWGDYWRFTNLAARRVFADVFGEENVTVQSYGNSFAAVALLQGLTAEELTTEELDRPDRDYEIIIAVRAVKR